MYKETYQYIMYTIKILNGMTDRSEQTVQTQIRLLLKEQSDQGLHCLPFHLHLLDVLLHCKTKLFHFGTIMVTMLGVYYFRISMGTYNKLQ